MRKLSIITKSIVGLWGRMVLIAILIAGFISSTSTSQNCRVSENLTETRNRPVVKYHVFDEAERSDKNRESYPYSTYRLVEPGSNITFLQEGGGIDAWFLCNHTAPSKWVTNVEQVNSQVEMLSYSIRETTDYYDPSTYRYISVMRLILGKGHSLTLLCEEVECPKIRQPVIINAEESTPTPYAHVLSPEIEMNSTEIIDFDMERAKIENLNAQNSNETCPYTLNFVYDEKNYAIKVKWSKRSLNIDSIPTKSAMGLENSFRLIQELDVQCVNYTPVFDSTEFNDTCSDCEPIAASNHGFEPISFFNDYKGIKRVFKIYFDLQANLYFRPGDPYPIEPRSLVGFQDVPSILYRGQKIPVKCLEMVAGFSYGFVVMWNVAGDPEPQQTIYLNDDDSKVLEGYIQTQTHLTTNKTFLDENNVTDITITCIAPVWNSNEWVNRSISRQLLESEYPSIKIFSLLNNVTIDHNDTIFIKSGSDLTIQCISDGIPLPEITKYVPPSNFSYNEMRDTVIINNENKIVLTIEIHSIKNFASGIHKCIAENSIGSAEKQFTVSVTEGFPLAIIYALAALGIVLLIFAAVSAILLVKYRRERVEFLRQTEEVIQRFKDGFVGKTAIDFNTNHEYRDFEVPLTNWGIGGTMLGSGAFGVVQKGFIQRGRSKTIVAIKTVNAPKEVEDFESSLMELVIMSYIGHHEHVVSLVASCTDNLKRRSLLIGVEYCSNGDLLSYIQKRKSIFHNFVNEKGYISLDKITHSFDDSYANVVASGGFSTMDLYRWSYQIANGMAFLASKKVLHADLAARNILLTDDNTAKISDFGLSRQLMESDSYTKKTNVPLPWRWMSLEALRFRKFSCQSDVWSYGVLLYEVFTLGDTPWPGLAWTHEFSDELEKGRRLSRPTCGTIPMYEKVMLECWRNEPEERLTFDECRKFFETALAKLNSTEGKDDEYVLTC